MDEEHLQQGYSARLLRRPHGVPTQNKRLQNIEHGLAVRDKIRIINYIQTKPTRKASVSPVAPHFKCLAEELLSAGAALNAMSTSPREDNQNSPPEIVGRLRHRSEDSDGGQVGFSARKLGQMNLERSTPSPDQSSPSPFSSGRIRHQSGDSDGHGGFSARKLGQMNLGRSTPSPDQSSPSPFSSGRIRHQSGDSDGLGGFSARKLGQIKLGKSTPPPDQSSPSPNSSGRIRHQSEDSDGLGGFSARKLGQMNLGRSTPPPDQRSESPISSERIRHQSEDSDGQGGFSARKLGQMNLGRSTPKPDQRSESPISSGRIRHQSEDSDGQVGFSARKLGQMNLGRSTPKPDQRSESPISSGRIRHHSEDSAGQVGFSARKLGQMNLGRSTPSPDQRSPSPILSGRIRHQNEDSDGQGGFSARKLGQMKLERSTPPSDQRSESPISSGRTRHQSGDSDGQGGFSARKLGQMNLGRSTPSSDQRSESPISSGRIRHQSEDGAIGFSARKLYTSSTSNKIQSSQMDVSGVRSDGGTDMEQKSQVQGQSSTAVTNSEGTPTTPPQKVGFSARNAFSGSQLTSTYNSPVAADKIQFALQSPSPKSPVTMPHKVGERTQKAIITKAKARRDWQNSRRPGLASPTLSDSSCSSDGKNGMKHEFEDNSKEDLDSKEENYVDSKQSTDPKMITAVSETKQEDTSQVSPVVGFSTRKLVNKSPVVKNRVDPISPTSVEAGSSAIAAGEFSSENPVKISSSQTSQVVIGRSPPPGFSLATSNPRTSPIPSSSIRFSPEKSTEKTSSETSQVSRLTRRSPSPGLSTVKSKSNPPVGFSARNPLPGLSQLPVLHTEMKTTRQSNQTKSMDLIMQEPATTDLTIMSKSPCYMARHPPPGFSARQPPPGFTSGNILKAPPGFGPQVTSPSAITSKRSSPSVIRPKSPCVDDPSSPSLDTKDTLHTQTEPTDTASLNQANTVARLARQQSHPYTTAPAVPTGSSPERVKRTLSSAKAELEAIKKAHMAVTHTIPPHVKKLEAALERITAKHRMQDTNQDIAEGDKNRNNGYNHNNSTDHSDDEEVGVPVKVMLATWRAINVSYSFLVSNNHKQFAFGISNLCHLLKTHGKEMEDYNKDGMNKIFASIRNIILDHSKKLSHRIELLQIVELRAKKWTGSNITDENSTQCETNITVSDSGDGSASLGTTLIDDDANNNVQKKEEAFPFWILPF
ncbi:uncharacterized protein [Amphiura filiformis]|uniref:uncharacterized protein isoform X2 n=1 Tax=Amphiura filiformis TaxID=82378 RepID=UPI003B22349A